MTDELCNGAASPLDLSVVIPAFNEADSILPLLGEVTEALSGQVAYEVVVVDDGSDDGTAEAVAGATPQVPHVRVVRHRARAGQSSALLTGVQAAEAPWVATLDGDGQNDPRDIPKLWSALRGAAGDPPALIYGQRGSRRDPWSKRVASRAANWVRRAVLHDGATDTGCGLKLFRRRSYLGLPRFDHMHRFLPALFQAADEGVLCVEVSHRPRQAGTSKYGNWDRFVVGILDLAGVWWLSRRPLSGRSEARDAGADEEP